MSTGKNNIGSSSQKRYLHSVFITQSGPPSKDVRVADSGASYYITHDYANMNGIRPSPLGREPILIGDGRRLKVECVRSRDVNNDGYMDECRALFVLCSRSRRQPVLVVCHATDPYILIRVPM